MKSQSAIRHLRMLAAVGAVTFALPAAAEEQASEAPQKSRDAKRTEAAAPAVDLKMEGIRNDREMPAVPKEGEPTPEVGSGTSCKQDCEGKLPAGSSTPVASQVETQQVPGTDLAAPRNLATSESAANRHRLGAALGVGGILVAAMGSYMAIGALATHAGADQAASTGLGGFFFAGLAGIGVGAGLMIGGFSLAAANPVTPADRGPLPVQPPNRAGMGVSLSGTF